MGAFDELVEAARVFGSERCVAYGAAGFRFVFSAGWKPASETLVIRAEARPSVVVEGVELPGAEAELWLVLASSGSSFYTGAGTRIEVNMSLSNAERAGIEGEELENMPCTDAARMVLTKVGIDPDALAKTLASRFVAVLSTATSREARPRIIEFERCAWRAIHGLAKTGVVPWKGTVDGARVACGEEIETSVTIVADSCELSAAVLGPATRIFIGFVAERDTPSGLRFEYRTPILSTFLSELETKVISDPRTKEFVQRIKNIADPSQTQTYREKLRNCLNNVSKLAQYTEACIKAYITTKYLP